MTPFILKGMIFVHDSFAFNDHLQPFVLFLKDCQSAPKCIQVMQMREKYLLNLDRLWNYFSLMMLDTKLTD